MSRYRRTRLLFLVMCCCLAASVTAQSVDPRTAEGQLAACGGADAWNSLGFLDFSVTITTNGTVSGPWRYRWDRRNSFFRISGPYPQGGTVDLALDIGSRSGGGWMDGESLTGEALSAVVDWAFARFSEDLLWLTFPLGWRAPGVTVTPGPPAANDAGEQRLTTTIVSPVGRWSALLDPQTGLVTRTVLDRPGGARLTVEWSAWTRSGGVAFAGMRRFVETGEEVSVTVNAALATTPADAF